MINYFFTIQFPKFQYIFENGGSIMIIIFLLGFTIWFLLLTLFFQKAFRQNSSSDDSANTLYSVAKKNPTDNPKNRAFIKTLISICPLIGLLGSTTGMVEVFKVIELYGTDAPQVGLSLPRVVIPTLVALMISISGLIGLKIIDQRENLINRAN